mgnify:CR=1 FL=1
MWFWKKIEIYVLFILYKKKERKKKEKKTKKQTKKQTKKRLLKNEL